MPTSNTASKHRVVKPAQAVKKNYVNGFPAESELKDLQFKLAHHLQTTLDVTATLNLFYDNIQELFTINGLFFKDKKGFELSLGAKARHTAQYNVTSGKVSLGHIELKRSQPFLETELAVIEMLIGVLFYPLRNALLYRRALQNSMRDTLTGLGNREAMENCFNRELKLAARHNMPLSMIIVDIDHFKDVNDTHGHLNGDRILKHVVNNIKSSLRETDQMFRFGGEEFVILLHNTNQENAKLTAERIRMLVALSPFEIEGKNIQSTISLGVTSLQPDDTSEHFFERADNALYKAKNTGRNKVIES